MGIEPMFYDSQPVGEEDSGKLNMSLQDLTPIPVGSVLGIAVEK